MNYFKLNKYDDMKDKQFYLMNALRKKQKKLKNCVL